MDKVNINTSQNVQISYTLAGLSDRIFASLIDFLIVISISLVVLVIVLVLELSSPYTIISVFTIPLFFYDLICEVSMNGQTVGKRILNIKVVKLDGSEPGIGSYLLRWIIRPIDIYVYGSVATICIIMSKHGQRLGDMAAGTTVIKVKAVRNFLEQHAVNKIDENYMPVFFEAVRLRPVHIDLIKKAIDARIKRYDERPAAELAKKIEEEMGIQSDMPPLKFLDTVLKDYHYFTLKE